MILISKLMLIYTHVTNSSQTLKSDYLYLNDLLFGFRLFPFYTYFMLLLELTNTVIHL